jgi:23S rRNA (cytidine1920-2'-O)/16S rRNA (cytidine1409-2'-O)-methyltransferase
VALVERGVVSSRAQAGELIERGAVIVGGAPALKGSRLVSPAEPIALLPVPSRYVSRGGTKLEAALAGFGLSVAGLRVLDAGASTGGFTDCLLQHGAVRVVAVDVGRGQLRERLRNDPRVVARERCDIRSLTAESAAGPFDAVTADLSFISLTQVVPVLAGPLAVADAPLVLLVKPQFEVGRVEASRGRGVIRSPFLHTEALVRVGVALAHAEAETVAIMASPITGHAGNVEFLLHARAHAGARTRLSNSDGRSALGAMARAAVARAHGIEAAVLDGPGPTGAPGGRAHG